MGRCFYPICSRRVFLHKKFIRTSFWTVLIIAEAQRASNLVLCNHVRCILSAENVNLFDIIKDFKRHSASKILKEKEESTESRKDWIIKRFEFAAKSPKRKNILAILHSILWFLYLYHYENKSFDQRCSILCVSWIL